MKKRLDRFLVVIIGVSILSFLSWLGYRLYRWEESGIDSGCDRRLEAALKADNIKEALGEIKKALVFLEKNNFTSGNTKLWFQAEESKWDDIGAWYTGLKHFYEKRVSEQPRKFCAKCEEREFLITFREELRALLPSSGYSPDGISVYPYNTECELWSVISVLIFFISIFIYGVRH